MWNKGPCLPLFPTFPVWPQPDILCSTSTVIVYYVLYTIKVGFQYQKVSATREYFVKERLFFLLTLSVNTPPSRCHLSCIYSRCAIEGWSCGRDWISYWIYCTEYCSVIYSTVSSISSSTVLEYCTIYSYCTLGYQLFYLLYLSTALSTINSSTYQLSIIDSCSEFREEGECSVPSILSLSWSCLSTADKPATSSMKFHLLLGDWERGEQNHCFGRV
jgi:hypothetical protein